jgi:hypothetical protein
LRQLREQFLSLDQSRVFSRRFRRQHFHCCRCVAFIAFASSLVSMSSWSSSGLRISFRIENILKHPRSQTNLSVNYFVDIIIITSPHHIESNHIHHFQYLNLSNKHKPLSGSSWRLFLIFGFYHNHSITRIHPPANISVFGRTWHIFYSELPLISSFGFANVGYFSLRFQSRVEQTLLVSWTKTEECRMSKNGGWIS